MKYITTVVLFTILCTAVVAQDTTKKATPPTTASEATKKQPLIFVKTLAEFPGGDDSLAAFLHRNIKYPAEAKEKKIEGTVELQFVVNADGSIRDIKVLHGLEGGCTEEVIRVVKLMPKFKPAADLVPVATYYNLPVEFRLPDKY